jgi:hypothetical protein
MKEDFFLTFDGVGHLVDVLEQLVDIPDDAFEINPHQFEFRLGILYFRPPTN